MKKILLKSLLATLLSIAGSLLVVVTIVPAMGGVVDGNAWLMCIVCPLAVAAPASCFTFWQAERLQRAHQALEAAHRELAGAHRELTERARRDPMTGLLNRESFFLELDAERRRGRGTLLIMDADHFKAINDRHGHLVGDQALLEIAAAISRGVRAGDVVGRIGGEEFGALLIGAGGDDATRIAERVRREVEQIRFRPDAGGVLPLTVSIGGTELLTEATVSDHMRAADARLYAAKNAGRNRTVFDPGTRAAA
jgi:diguanylate cyclase (GGDEF)-like protein